MPLIVRRAFTSKPSLEPVSRVCTYGTYKKPLLMGKALPQNSSKRLTAFGPPYGTELREQAHSSVSCLIKAGFGCLPSLGAWQDAVTR